MPPSPSTVDPELEDNKRWEATALAATIEAFEAHEREAKEAKLEWRKRRRDKL